MAKTMRNEKQKELKKNKWQQHKIETFSSILPCGFQYAFVFCSSVDAIVKSTFWLKSEQF